MNKTIAGLSIIALLLASMVIGLGAFTRLVDAGLGCPDWPTCYGHLWVPTTQDEIDIANRNFSATPVEVNKTWPEQLHRIFAKHLGLVILLLFILCNKSYARAKSKSQINPLSISVILLVCVTVSRIVLGPVVEYLLGPIFASFLFVLVYEYRRDKKRDQTRILYLLSALVAGMVILQGLFGMWTVTLNLWPQVVTAHLLGGIITLSLLTLVSCWVVFGIPDAVSINKKLLLMARFALVFVFIQVALGGWTTSNYAALACPDMPLCQNKLIPDMDFKEGFNFTQAIGPNYLGGELDNKARVAIHFTHRVGAIFVCISVLYLVIALFRTSCQRLRLLSILIVSVLVIQVSLGISNVVLSLPLANAVLHNFFGGLLMGLVFILNFYFLRNVEVKNTF